jgi:5'-deoxynucleotidase YfbR-like HD superfamily hydrolase
MKKPRLNIDKSIRTYSGKYLNVFSPRPEDIDIVDIAHGLSHMCRFGGHTKKYYSVAEHSIFVCNSLPSPKKLAGLMHDASEAYLLDIPTPIKIHLPEYLEIEHNLMLAIASKFGFTYPKDSTVESADKSALVYEWENIVLSDNVNALSPLQAKDKFLEMFYTLTAKSRKTRTIGPR